MKLILILCASMLFGCASLSTTTPDSSPALPASTTPASTTPAATKSSPEDFVLTSQNDSPRVAERRKQLSQTRQWAFSARLSVRRNTDAWAGQIRWQQTGPDYLIHFNAPMGQGAMQLKSNPQFGVEMRLADGTLNYADDPQSLLYDFTGWEIPMNGLKYWIQGIPDKEPVKAISYNADGQIEVMQQGNWQIQYRTYREIQEMYMPRKLILRNGPLKIVLVVDHWDIKL